MKAGAVVLGSPAWIDREIDSDRIYPDDDARMALAIELARRNVEYGTGGPFGAVVFDDDGRIISIGVNSVIAQCCSIAHAEIMALASAQQKLQRARLNESGGRFVLATSAQPCCQCYGAIVWAGIDALLIGARGEDVESLAAFDEGPLPEDWIGALQKRGVAVVRDLRRDDSCAVLSDYTKRGGKHY